MIKKITRRATWFFKNIFPIFFALVTEPRKHPWKYIFDYLFVSAQVRYSRTQEYLKRYFNPIENGGATIVDCGDFVMKMSNSLYYRESFMVGFLSVYYDVVYPAKVRFPIPVIVCEGPYEYSGVSLSPGDYVIDGGANVGVFSMFAAKKVGAAGKIFCFEPISDAYAVIKTSAEANSIPEENIQIIPQAIGEKSGKIEFKFSLDNIGGSSPTISGNSQIVNQTTIDEFIIKNNINKINFIKMDIEGAECDALIGASQTIKRFKPKLAICTYHHPDHPLMIEKIIKDLRPDYAYKHTSHKIYAW